MLKMKHLDLKTNSCKQILETFHGLDHYLTGFEPLVLTGLDHIRDNCGNIDEIVV